jgi:hypothetical protein
MHIMMLTIRLQLLTKTSGDCGRTATCNLHPASKPRVFFPQGFCVLGPLRIIVKEAAITERRFPPPWSIMIIRQALAANAPRAFRRRC